MRIGCRVGSVRRVCRMQGGFCQACVYDVGWVLSGVCVGCRVGSVGVCVGCGVGSVRHAYMM